MAISDKNGLPVSVDLASASPHEIKLVEGAVARRFTQENPKLLIGDRAYDSDQLDKKFLQKQIHLIAPHKSNRRKPVTQDGRTLRRYKRRWKVERLNAWLQNFRKVVVRYEYHASNYFGFVQLACLIILLRNYF